LLIVKPETVSGLGASGLEGVLEMAILL
jgi:hypothetical protein